MLGFPPVKVHNQEVGAFVELSAKLTESPGAIVVAVKALNAATGIAETVIGSVADVPFPHPFNPETERVPEVPVVKLKVILLAVGVIDVAVPVYMPRYNPWYLQL